MKRHRVFAYGTLTFPGIATAVAGERLAFTPARIEDHARHALRGRPYPGAIPRPGHCIEGVLLDGVSPAALARIDDFEGELYRRREVTVVDTEGARRPALVYLLRPRWHPLLLERDWCPDTFRREWHDRYVEQLSREYGTREFRERSRISHRFGRKIGAQ